MLTIKRSALRLFGCDYYIILLFVCFSYTSFLLSWRIYLAVASSLLLFLIAVAATSLDLCFTLSNSLLTFPFLLQICYLIVYLFLFLGNWVVLQGTYSTQIFSLAVLLSSMFIYNQVGKVMGICIYLCDSYIYSMCGIHLFFTCLYTLIFPDRWNWWSFSWSSLPRHWNE